MTLSANGRGAALMTSAMAAWTVSDACMKSLGGALPLGQALLLRGVVVTAMLVAYGLARGQLVAPSRPDRGWLALRTAAEIAAAWTFVSALFHMPLANATAILQALSLVMVLAGALMGERVGPRRWTAVGAGFAGMLLIVRPGTEGFDHYSLYALGTVLAVTVRDLATRRISQGLPSPTIGVAAAGGVTAFAALLSLGEDFAPLGAASGAALAGASLATMVAYLVVIAALRSGDVSFTAPFRYTSLLWALALGWLVFGDWPSGLTLLGAAIVAGAGAYTLRREAARAPRKAMAGVRGLRQR